MNKIAPDYPALIYEFRGYRIMVDFHLAALYEVETRTLKQAVKRNIDRFPDDFMFELNRQEIHFLITQNAILSKKRLGGAKPMAFTEQGVAMLSSILRSDKAIQVNIEIMRAFSRYRALLTDTDSLRDEIHALDEKVNQVFELLLNRINALHEEKQPRKPIGFRRKGGQQLPAP